MKHKKLKITVELISAPHLHGSDCEGCFFWSKWGGCRRAKFMKEKRRLYANNWHCSEDGSGVNGNHIWVLNDKYFKNENN